MPFNAQAIAAGHTFVIFLGEGFNQPPDASLPDQVRNWNAKHTYPKLIIATTAGMFHDFEMQSADKIPVVTGDFTPYWEDGAASSRTRRAASS